MLEMSWITAILQLYSQVPVLFGNVIVKRMKMRNFDLLSQFHYILNLPRICVEDRPFRLQPFRGNNCGMIPVIFLAHYIVSLAELIYLKTLY